MANDFVNPQQQQEMGLTLGRYHLLQQIGRGGMSEVWLGMDPRLHRQVAIKILPVRSPADWEFSQRFEREARAAAALNHPHILPVHDYGEQILPGGQAISYIVMSYISGGSLADRIATLKDRAGARPAPTSRVGDGMTLASSVALDLMPQDEAINYLFQAAKAIDYAHTQAIIHRDIKPANMLLRNSNWLLLADFGIARILSDQEQLTQTGMSFGTPEYMAPEQAQGKAEASSDLYSLAVIAYQLFTGRLPFIADTAYAIAMQHVLTQPTAPRQINPSLSLAAERVLLRGLAKEPAQRYPSAHIFVTELQRGLARMAFESTLINQPLPSAPSSNVATLSGGQGSRFIEGSEAYINTPVGGVPSILDEGQKPVPSHRAVAIHSDGKGSRFIEGGAPSTGITRRQVLTGSAALIALGGLGTWAILSRPQPGLLPTHKISRRVAANPGSPTMTLLAHTKPIVSLAWSPAANILASAGQDNQVILWDFRHVQPGQTSSLQPRARQQFDTGVNILLAWAPDGEAIAIGNGATDSKSFNGIVLVYTGDLRSPMPGYHNTLSLPFLNALAWAPGKYLVAAATLTASNHSYLELWDPTQPAQLLPSIKLPSGVSPGANNTPDPMAFAPDGSMLAIGLDDGVLASRLSVSGKKVRWQPYLPLLKFDQFSSEGDAVSWSSNSRYVAATSASSGHALAVWNWKTRDRTLLPSASDTNAPLTTLAWSPAPTSTLLAVGDRNGAVYVWNINSTRGNTVPVQTFPGINAEVQALAWSKDGQWLAAGYNDANDSILIWKI